MTQCRCALLYEETQKPPRRAVQTDASRIDYFASSIVEDDDDAMTMYMHLLLNHFTGKKASMV